MNLDKLRAAIRDNDLGDHEAAILETARPAIFLALGEASGGGVGHSRIGGDPDLPPSLAWPTTPKGRLYLCFLLQINLAELPTLPSNPFPPRGMLYLFLDDGDDGPWQVIFYDGDESLQQTAIPDREQRATDYLEEIAPHLVRFNLGVDIPHWATSDFEALCKRIQSDGVAEDAKPEETITDSLYELGRAIRRTGFGKLLGHAAGIGHDPRMDAYVARDVNADWLYNYPERAKLDEANAQNWQNLLLLYSEDSLGLMFGDAGYLQVLVHADDLQRFDLSRVYVGLESS